MMHLEKLCSRLGASKAGGSRSISAMRTNASNHQLKLERSGSLPSLESSSSTSSSSKQHRKIEQGLLGRSGSKLPEMMSNASSRSTTPSSSNASEASSPRYSRPSSNSSMSSGSSSSTRTASLPSLAGTESRGTELGATGFSIGDRVTISLRIPDSSSRKGRVVGHGNKTDEIMVNIGGCVVGVNMKLRKVELVKERKPVSNLECNTRRRKPCHEHSHVAHSVIDTDDSASSSTEISWSPIEVFRW